MNLHVHLHMSPNLHRERMLRKTSQAAARAICESDAGAAGSTRARTTASLRLAWLTSIRRVAVSRAFFESVRDLCLLSIFLSLLFMAKCARGTDATSRANSIRFNDSGAVQPRAERLCVATATRSTLRSVHASAKFRLAASAMADSSVIPPADDTATKLDVGLGGEARVQAKEA